MTQQAGNPKYWWEVYQGDEECKLFKELSRAKEEWRTTKGLASRTGLTEKRTEEIISRYLKSGIIQAHSTDAGKWRYWERAGSKPKAKSIAKTNQDKRVAESN